MDADLVLEGGGVKGIGLVGALKVFGDAGYRFRRVAGTSAGAIVGSLTAAGVPPEQLQRIMRELDYRKFQDGDFLSHLGAPTPGCGPGATCGSPARMTPAARWSPSGPTSWS